MAAAPKAPTVSIVFSTAGAGVDLSVPRATAAATLSLGNASFLASGLFTVLQPYVGVYAAPISVDTHIPVDWRAATPAAAPAGAWNVGPPRASTLWTTTSCGQASATLAWAGGSPASGVLTGSAVAELPNAVACVNAVLREYGLGPFASTATGEALMRSSLAFAVPKGSVRLVLPAIGEVTLPLGVSTRLWLVGDTTTSPAQGAPAFTRPLHNASVWPGMFVVTEEAAPGLARAVGVASHSGEDTSAISAGVAAGCAAGNGGFPVNCASWDALWRSAGFLGVDGILLAGECPAGSEPLRVCASVSVSPGAFGVLNFGEGGLAAGDSGDLIRAIATSAASPSGLAPARLTVEDNPWITFDYAYIAGWELVPLAGAPSGELWQGVALTWALLYGNVVASTVYDGTDGWFDLGYNFSLPRVPSAACALPLPSRNAGAAPSATRGFNAITSEACTRLAVQPLLDLGMDFYVDNVAAGPPGGADPLAWLAWGAGAFSQFFINVWTSASSALTAYASVAWPRSEWAGAGMATAGNLIDQGARWVIALLTGASAVDALYPAVPAGITQLANNGNIAVSGITVSALATLEGSFLADVTFDSANGGSYTSTINSFDAAWAAAK